jgi:hypothetical protein
MTDEVRRGEVPAVGGPMDGELIARDPDGTAYDNMILNLGDGRDHHYDLDRGAGRYVYVGSVGRRPEPPAVAVEPGPELIEALANAIYQCDNDPPLNARTVPHRWAIYQTQARNIVWPKIEVTLLATGWTPPLPPVVVPQPAGQDENTNGEVT